MSESKVSVIVPVYNVEKYLCKCLDSILAQTYKDLEIILINDGSTDTSADICKRYACADERIVFLTQENQGQSVARNRGLDIAAGAFIVFVDADDFIHPQAIDVLLSGLESADADICMCNYVSVDGTAEVSYDPVSFKVDSVDRDVVFENLFNENHITYGCLWGKIYKRHLFADLRFPKGRVYEDTYIITDLLYKAKALSFDSNKLYYYVSRGDSTIHSWTEKKIDDSLYATEHRVKFFLRYGKKELLKKAVCLHLDHAILCCKRTADPATLKQIRSYYSRVLRLCPHEIFTQKEWFMYRLFYISPKMYWSVVKIKEKIKSKVKS